MSILIYYLIGINVIAFCLYGIDKRQARRKQWRISEATLLGIALIGGSGGALLGMETFRHKTKHWKFKILLPLFLVVHTAILVWLG